MAWLNQPGKNRAVFGREAAACVEAFRTNGPKIPDLGDPVQSLKPEPSAPALRKAPIA